MAESPEEGRAAKSKRPEDSAFKQQKLPAWQPVLTASTVLPTFFVIGFAFLPIAIGLFFSSQSVQEKQIEYTNCTTISMEPSLAGKACSAVLEEEKQRMIENNASYPLNCTCEMKFNLEESYMKDVFLYYKLTNFYQNHRRYVKSRDDNQLAGKLNPKDTPSDDCIPFQLDSNSTPIAPCGAVANSLFNDSITLYHCGDETCNAETTVQVIKTGIAWPTDKSTKFQNPPHEKGLELAFEGTAKPPFWSKNIWELDTVTKQDDKETNNGYQNEDFIVWMRTAALPNFRKLYRRVDHEAVGYENDLPNGTYKLIIEYNYPVISFDGTKTFIVANTSWMGGKNLFLAAAYFAVSLICIALGLVFLVIHIKMPLKQNAAHQPSAEAGSRH